VIVRRQNLPIGQIGFLVTISPNAAADRSVLQTNHQRQFERVFASYASPDRAEVLKRVQVLRVAGIKCFQDVLDLEPGERWEHEVYRNIDRADLFLLFWSRAAKRSKWVRREAKYALSRQSSDPDAEPEIRPVLLPPSGRPRSARRIEPPWPELAHLHFNDLTIQML
jgi:hypothetical protein